MSDLHTIAFCFFVGIGTIVFGALLISLIKFRSVKGSRETHFHKNLGIEIIWTMVPFAILIAMTIPATIVFTGI